MLGHVAHIATVDLTLAVLVRGQLEAMRDAGYEVAAISAPGPWTPALEREGIQHIPWTHATRAWDLSADMRAMRELIGILRRERFQIVHTHTPKAGVMGRIAARIVGVPLVANTVHGFNAAPHHARRERALVMSTEWLAARFSHIEFYQSSADLRRAQRLRMLRANRAILIGNGTDLNRFRPMASDSPALRRLRAELGLLESAIVVGTVGRLVAEKGYLDFLDVADRIARTDPDIRFLAVGQHDPAKHDALDPEQLAEHPNIVFTGWRDDIPEVLGLMDIFVLASWREGFPRSAVEAAAMGKPLILSDIPGCRELGNAGVDAVFVPPRDAGALAAAILELAHDPAERARIGAAAGRSAAERFDEGRIAERIIETYQQHLPRPKVRLS